MQKIQTRQQAISLILHILTEAMRSTYSDEKGKAAIQAAIDYMVVHDGW